MARELVAGAESSKRDDAAAKAALLLAGGAALLASSCCVLPLVLVLVGISGAWIGQLHRLEPYSPWLTGAAIVSLLAAGYWIYRPAKAKASNDECAIGDGRACGALGTFGRRWFWVVAVLTAVPIVAAWVAPSFY
jgi:mercuric ion transport protein